MDSESPIHTEYQKNIDINSYGLIPSIKDEITVTVHFKGKISEILLTIALIVLGFTVLVLFAIGRLTL